MDPYASPYIIPNNSPHNPFPHSLLRTRQSAAEDLKQRPVGTKQTGTLRLEGCADSRRIGVDGFP